MTNTTKTVLSPIADSLQAQQHANQAQLSKQKAPLWALQLGAHSSISSTVLAAKRLHPYRKQFKLLRQSQKQKATVKKNSVKKQRIHSVRCSPISMLLLFVLVCAYVG